MGSLSFGFKGFLKMCFVFSALVLACTVGIASASAAVVTWQGDESVNWGTGGNWSTGSVPGTADIATFDGTGNTPCTINTAANVRGIDINTGYTNTITQAATLTVGISNYDQADGIFSGSTQDIDINGSFTLNSGATFISTSGNIYFFNTFTIAEGAGSNAWQHNNGTVVFDSNGSQSWTFDSTNVEADETFYNFQMNPSAGCSISITVNETFVVTGTLTLTDGNLEQSTIPAGGTIVVTGAISQGANFDGGTAQINLEGSGTATLSSGYMTGLKLNGADTVVTGPSSGTLIFENHMIIAAGTYNGGVGAIGFSHYTKTFTQSGGTFNGGAGTVTFGGDMTISGGTYNNGTTTTLSCSTCVFTLSGGTLNLGSGTMNLAHNWAQTSGSVTEGTSTVNFNSGNGTATIDVNTAETFYNLTFSTDTGWTKQIANGDTLTVTGTLTLTDGLVSQSSIPATGSISVAGDVVVGSGYDGGTATIVLTGDATQTFTLGAVGVFNADITVNKTGGAVNLASELTMDAVNQDLTITAGTFDISGYTFIESGGTFTVASGGNLQLQGGETVTGTPTFASGSTVTYDGAAGPYTMKDWTMTNATLVINGGVSSVFTLGATEIVANATITSGILSLGANGLTVSTTFSNEGTLRWRGSGTLSLPAMDTNSGTIEFTGDGDAGADTYTVTTLSATYYNLIINSTDGATDIFELGVALDVNGSLTITAGTFNVTGGNYQINVGRNFSNTGTFNSSSGTVVFDDATGTGTIAGSTSFFNFTCTTVAKSLVFTAATTQMVTGAFTLTGSAGNTIVLRSSADASQWLLNISGTSAISYVDVKDSDASSGNDIIAKGTNSVNSGNNLGWIFNVAPTVATITAVELTDGTGVVNISFIIDDDDDDTNRALVEYNVGAGWLKATLSETSGTGSTYGQFNLENDNAYQVGNSNGYVLTSPGANTITAIWNSKTDAPTADLATAQIRVTPYDGYDIGTPGASSDFIIDNAGPAGGFAGFAGGATTSSTITWIWTAGTDSHFNHYEVWYGTNETDVGNRNGTASEWDNDPNDATLATATTATTTITGLLENTTYYAKIWAVDGYGNETTLTVATANNNGRPIIGGVTIAQSGSGNQYVNIQFVFDDADDTDLGRVLIQYNIGAGWNKATIDEASGTGSTYGWFDVENDDTYQVGNSNGYITSSSGANTVSVVWRSDVDALGIDLETVQLKITPHDGIEAGAAVTSDAFIVDGVAPTTPESFTKTGGSGTTGILTWTVSTESHFNHYEIWYGTNQTDVTNRNGTAIEWDNDPNDVLLATKATATTTVTGLTPGLTYYAKICSADNYGYEGCGSAISFVTNQTPTAATVTAVQATDGTSNVTITFVIDDADNDDTLQALVEYNVGAGWNKATLSETTGTGATYGNYNLENDNTYQVGNSNGYIVTSPGANTITVIWASAEDVTAQNIATAQVRATPYDGIAAGSSVASDNFVLDQVVPSGGLASSLTATNIVETSFTLGWNSVTSETNFDKYEIYYRTSSTTTYTLYGSSNTMTASSMGMSGLVKGTTYICYIKALDTKGNNLTSSTITVTTKNYENPAYGEITGGGASSGGGYDNTEDNEIEEISDELEEEVEEISESEDVEEEIAVVIEITVGETVEETEKIFEETWTIDVVPQLDQHWSESYLKDFYQTTLINEINAGDTTEAQIISYLFDPDEKVTRIEFLMSAMDLINIEIDTHMESMPFVDMTVASEGAAYVLTAYNMGVITGYDDSTFKPDNLVNRAEALKIIFGLTGDDIEERYGDELLDYYYLPSNPFPDVDLDSWYAPYIVYAYTRGIVSGYGDGYFRPERDIALGEMAKIITIVIAQEDYENSFYAEAGV
ncbi:MAG: S-layer-like protein domain-containing protein [Candidatus Peregrinibacteria bacterium GW2011_GWF2_43_17]|nr:MAG: S-layer-like protein domain-containing protein [Candidatus Peregrinibacteria bacterium GW2011_GWF2_43_17]HAU40220.1 hypothetical protein [Candidatus Peregrinibacteria bacterium]